MPVHISTSTVLTCELVGEELEDPEETKTEREAVRARTRMSPMPCEQYTRFSESLPNRSHFI